jgi:hypothetical protein
MSSVNDGYSIRNLGLWQHPPILTGLRRIARLRQWGEISTNQDKGISLDNWDYAISQPISGLSTYLGKIYTRIRWPDRLSGSALHDACQAIFTGGKR